MQETIIHSTPDEICRKPSSIQHRIKYAGNHHPFNTGLNMQETIIIHSSSDQIRSKPSSIISHEIKMCRKPLSISHLFKYPGMTLWPRSTVMANRH
jgi:hypothetical protein